MNRKELLEKCKAVGKTTAKSRLPILECLRIEPYAEGITITGTDLELIVTAYSEGAINEAVAVPCAPLVKALTASKAEEVSLSVDGDSLTLTTDKTKVTIDGYPASDYPCWPVTEDWQEVAWLDAATLSPMLTRAIECASSDESKAILTGICWECQGDALRLVATDTYRLSTEVYPDATAEPFTAILPCASAVWVKNHVKAGEVRVRVSSCQMELSAPGFRVVSRLIDGQYPNWRRVMPSVFNTSVVYDKAALAEAIDSVAFVAVDNSNRATFTPNCTTAAVKAASGSMKVASELPAEITRAEGTDPYPIVFNHKYVDAFVSMIPKGGSIRMEGSGQVSPAKITSDQLPGWECVLMPMEQDDPEPMCDRGHKADLIEEVDGPSELPRLQGFTIVRQGGTECYVANKDLESTLERNHVQHHVTDSRTLLAVDVAGTHFQIRRAELSSWGRDMALWSHDGDRVSDYRTDPESAFSRILERIDFEGHLNAELAEAREEVYA